MTVASHMLGTIGTTYNYLDLTKHASGYHTYPDTSNNCKYPRSSRTLDDIYASLGASDPWVINFADTQC